MTLEEWTKLWLPELNPAQTQLLLDKMLEIIGPDIDKDTLVRNGDRQGAKEAMAINKRLEEQREKILGKPIKENKEWWK